MATGVDAKLLKSTKFPPEFSQKVDMEKVNLEVMKKWIAGKISEILGSEDDVVIELCFNLIEGSRYPDIKKLQIQLTGFLDKDTASFCKELWKLCLSAQSNPQGVPKELLEAKKLELIQEKIDAEKAAEEARRRREEEQRREREVNNEIETLIAERDEGLIDEDHAIRDHHAVETPEKEIHIEVYQGSQTPTYLLGVAVEDAMIEGDLRHLHPDLLLLHVQNQDLALHLGAVAVHHPRVAGPGRQIDEEIRTEDVGVEAGGGPLTMHPVAGHRLLHLPDLVLPGLPSAEGQHPLRSAYLHHQDLADLAAILARDLGLLPALGAVHHEEGYHAVEKGQDLHQRRRQMMT
ncbi:hypothetical protein EG329_005494 [Mollisiaceae sp. DMI_Dod_QoI]|nr:hypothetical protein EG329_005494 [Helotiales sp. DMI_Dod_QoI]